MPDSKEVWETGSEPEYQIDDFGAVEYLKDGSVRIAVCAEWRGALRTEYYVRVSKVTLADLGRRCLQIAADTHNRDELEKIIERTH